MSLLRTTALFLATALAEIIGCYLPYLCVAVALVWPWLVDGMAPRPTDVIGVAVALARMAIIVIGSPAR